MYRRHQLQGFTALELLVTIAILGVLAAMAAPSFTPLMERWRAQQASELLRSTFYFARSEAIKRGGQVVMEKLANNTNGCSLAAAANAWGCGWCVYDNQDGQGSCTKATHLLQRYDAPAKLQVVRADNGASPAKIELNRWGLPENAPNLVFNITPEGKATTDPAARSVCINSGGRVKVVTGASC